MNRRAMALWMVIAGVGCLPQVKPEAFAPGKKVAVVTYDTVGVLGAMHGVGVKVEDLSQPYAAFRGELGRTKGLELIDDQAVHDCPLYASLPALPTALIDMSSSVAGLRRTLVGPESAQQLAEALHADLIVVVHTSSDVKMTAGIGSLGAAQVRTTTRLEAYDTTGTEVWRDIVHTGSDSFPSAGGIQDPARVKTAALSSMTEAAASLGNRLREKVGG